MKFVDKNLALKLKEKGFDKPCFGYYKEKEDKLYLYGATGNVYSCLKKFEMKHITNTPTIDQVLEWLREEKDVDIVIYPIDRNTIFMGGEKYILSVWFCGERIYEIHKDNNDKYVKWEDACIAGIEYVVEHLI